MNAGSVVQVEGSRDGRLLFSGATGNSNLSHDLSILAHDLRCRMLLLCSSNLEALSLDRADLQGVAPALRPCNKLSVPLTLVSPNAPP